MIHSIKKWIAIKMVGRSKQRSLSIDQLEVKHLNIGIKSFNDSSYFAGISKEGFSFVTRQSFRNDKHNENWMMVHIPEEGVFGFENREMEEKEGFSQGELLYKCIKPGENWQLNYNGSLPQNNNTGQLKMDLNWQSVAPIVVFDKIGTTAKQVGTQIAKEKWDSNFFKKLKELDQVHYEQAGKLSGLFEWNGVKHNLDFVGVRDHSWGVRNWEDWDRHFWILGLLEDGSFFNFSMISYHFVKNLQAAFIFDNGAYTTIFKIPNFDEIEMDGMMPKSLSFDVIEKENGPIKRMSLEMKHFFPFHMDNDYYLRQAKADFSYGDKKGVGIAEMGINLKTYQIDVNSTY